MEDLVSATRRKAVYLKYSPCTVLDYKWDLGEREEQDEFAVWSLETLRWKFESKDGDI
jgi:hypothetical protein